jgi:ATP/maltotriose-dependent transcriptional regulator MalT
LAGDNPTAYLLLIECWAVAGETKEAGAVLERAEAGVTLPTDFHVGAATALLDHGGPGPFLSLYQGKNPPAVARPLGDLAEKIIEHGAVRHAGNARYFRDAASALMLHRGEAAERLADEAARLAPDSADILSLLGTIQALNGQAEKGRRTLRDAARRARKAGDRPAAELSGRLANIAADPRSLRMELVMAATMSQLNAEGMLGDFGLDDEDFYL